TRIVCAGLLAALVGCGPGLPPTVQLGGTVTLDGKPLSNALIGFHPADKDGAPAVFAPVSNGRYLAEVVPQGKYRVSFRSTTAPEGYGQPGGPVDSTFGAPKAANREPPRN